MSRALTRDDRQWLDDIASACAATREYVARGDLSEAIVFDAVCMRLVQIGEAVRWISAELLATEPDIPWGALTRLGERLPQGCFGAVHSIVEQTVTRDLIELDAAVDRMIARIGPRG